ncbi:MULTISPECIES: glycoside hydrolase family protein [Pseudomonas]|uniref:Lysozyme n=1 Tax=Pseudomonas lundensis TaxID=86185 RepID=A0AAX2HE98_9PSED|nr:MULTISPECIES: glycoside hydrolase family protein [Pseudomonas]NMY74170.1 lysozyme [Pseudomonas sp. WS 5071]NNA30650.1 lysozyme [Pseudomonas lundensis]SOB54763.1 Lysozyme [Pseudomonas lundensis]
MSQSRNRIAVGLLTMSLAGFGAWKASEGYTDTAVIPTKGDVPTIGHGSTRYEDGRPVRIGDTITPARAEVLARNLNSQAEKQFAASLPGVKLHQAEFDLYMDFTGQYGIGNWRASSMRRDLLAGNYAQACNDLLKYRYAAGFDCSTQGNRRCWGVWTRQLERNAKCRAAQ